MNVYRGSPFARPDLLVSNCPCLGTNGVGEAPSQLNSQMLAFGLDLKLVWTLSPQLEASQDHITNVWVKNGALWAGSWSGYSHRINHQTGEVIETKFTK